MMLLVILHIQTIFIRLESRPPPSPQYTTSALQPIYQVVIANLKPCCLRTAFGVWISSILPCIQGVSGGIVNILGGGSMDYGGTR